MKVLAFFGLLLLLAAPVEARPQTALLGHWKLQGDCRDYSGRGNHGANHAVALSSAGAQFDGIGSFIEVPDSKSLQLGANDFSVAVWVRCRPGATNAIGDILSKYDSALRRGFNLHLSGSGTGYSSTSDQRRLYFGIDNGVDGSWADCGRPEATNPLISALAVYRGDLYAATADAADLSDACRVYRYADGKRWVDCGRVSPDLRTRSVYSMIVHDGSLYVGTGTWDWEQSPSSGPNHVYRYEGGTKWHDCGEFGRGRRVMSLASHRGNLYATDDAGASWRYDGDGIWAFCGSVPTYKMISTLVYRDRLYAGADSVIYRYDDRGAWEPVGQFTYADVNQVHTMAIYEGMLHAGTWPLGRVLRFDGVNNWMARGDLGISTTGQRINEINDLLVFNGKLFAGVIPRGEVWRYERDADWTTVKQLMHVPGFSPESVPSWSRVPAMALFRGRLFAGTGSCQARTANADFSTEVGRVFSYEAGKCVSYDDDIGVGWAHIAAVRSKGLLKLYVDGNLVASSSPFDSEKFSLANRMPLLIGFGAENYFSGRMRDLRLYGGALSASEVKSLYAITRSDLRASEPEIHIVVSPGRFANIEQAAAGEERVDFLDGDTTDDDAATECFAATELRSFLSRCPDSQSLPIRLVSPGQLPPGGYVFVLGNRRSNPMVGCLDAVGKTQPSPGSPESYRIRAVTRGGRTLCVIEGGGRVGTLYGVYDYLRRIGFRFFGMGEKGVVRPAAPCKLIQELDIAESPAFQTRGFHAWQDRGNDDFFLWMARNRLALWTSAEKETRLLKKLGIRLAIGSHDVQTNFLNPKAEYPYNCPAFANGTQKPADPYRPSAEFQGDADRDGRLTYFEAHPEWFGLQEGKRSDRVLGLRGDNFCTSNEDAASELSKNFVRGLIDGVWREADVVNFWMEDGGRWCQCDRCKSLGTVTDRLLLLVHRVNQEVQEARKAGRLKRDVHLTTLAYLETIAPPSRPLPPDFDYEHCSVTFYPNGRCYVHDLADSKCTEFNSRYYENYLRWTTGEGRNYKGAMFIGEYYNVSVYWAMPALYTRVMSADIPMLYKTGTRHFHYMHTPTRLWGTWTLNQYLMARLLWNPDTDVPALLDDYFALYYPTTSKSTRAFYEHLERALCNINCIKAGGEIGVYEHLHYAPYRPTTNDGPDLLEIRDSLARAREYLDQALIECTDTAEALRLMEDERRFSYAEATVAFRYHVARIRMLDQRHEESLARVEFGHLEREAAALRGFGRDMVETFLVEGEADGLIASRGSEKYRAFEARFGKASQ